MSADGGASAAAVLAGAAAAALGAVEEVLLQAVADVGAELGRAAGDDARGGVAGVGVVALGVAAHDRLALLVSRRALAAGTLQAIAAVVSIRLCVVIRTVRCVAGALLFGIAGTRTCPADRLSRGELTVFAAILVGIIAHSVVLEPAGIWVTTAVGSTSLLTTAIALFVSFDNAVAACLTRDGGDTPIIGQTGRFDAVPAQRGTNVANGAGREFVDVLGRGWIHQKPLTGIAGVGVERTALLSVDHALVLGTVGCTIMDGTKCVADFMPVTVNWVRIVDK